MSSSQIPQTTPGLIPISLYNEMMAMYWDAVRGDLLSILLALRDWQTPNDDANISLPEQEDTFIHGYDAFLDHVNHTSRMFATRYLKGGAKAQPPLPGEPPKALKKRRAKERELYKTALTARALDIQAEINSASIRQEIRLDLQSSINQRSDTMRRRARLLLQSAQFLDIDKIIEHQRPPATVHDSSRQAPAQMMVSGFDETGMPIFVPQPCYSCKESISGSSFINNKTSDIMCEDCYRKTLYGHRDVKKALKRCCLSATILTGPSQMICTCPQVQRRDGAGRLKNLFPVRDGPESQERHMNPKGELGKIRCGLYELPDLLAEAKFQSIFKPTMLKEGKRTSLEEARRQEQRHLWKYKVDSQPKLTYPGQNSAAEPNRTAFANKRDSEFLGKNNNPMGFSNLHMSLRVGPLVIQHEIMNGLGSAVITTRDAPRLGVREPTLDDIQPSLIIAGQVNHRELYTQKRPQTFKRYSLMAKQVVGGAFSGFLDARAEDLIVDALLQEALTLSKKSSKQPEAQSPPDTQASDKQNSEASLQENTKQPGTGESSTSNNEETKETDPKSSLEEPLTRLMALVQPYLKPRIETYISSISSLLLNPATNFTIDPKTGKTHQSFIDSLLDQTLFGALFAPSTTTPSAGPLYLISFLTKLPETVAPVTPKNKYQVPNGFVEEYILSLDHHGPGHLESDMIDTLSEYWTDWGAFSSTFGGLIHPKTHHALFPWDCTERYCYSRYPVACGKECNLSKHVWAFPFDSWSIVSLHLARDRCLYPVQQADHAAEGAEEEGKINQGTAAGQMDDASWLENRMSVLSAQEALLTAAGAMARCEKFRKETEWIAQATGNSRRVKLGGIHRAQPFSHHFERGAYQRGYTAEWTHLSESRRVEEYERWRDWRIGRADVGDAREEDEGEEGLRIGDGFGEAVCAGVKGIRGDTCGTGCVSNCAT